MRWNEGPFESPHLRLDQLDQKITRVCISYMHLYPIKSLNHTLPSRKCKLCFWANIQVTSTLWPDIKSQKLSERRFKFVWTKSGSRNQLRQAKTDQDQHGLDKEAQDNLLEEDGGGWRHWQAGRPAWSAALARGPHRLFQATCRLLVGPLGRFGEFHPVAPCYKYKGVENRKHTPHLPLLSCSLLV